MDTYTTGTTFGKIDLNSLKELMRTLKPFEKVSLVGTQKAFGSLSKSLSENDEKHNLFDPFLGCGVTTLPPSSGERIKTGRVVSKDKFAEYEPKDMDWAEQAGLAEWDTVGIDDVVFQIKHPVSFEMKIDDPQFESIAEQCAFKTRSPSCLLW